SASVERNHKIPPACLTRSSLCRVVLFDHNDKGLEASIRLAPNEVVTEVRGHFLLMEEYEHYVDPVSDYNRYVMFYRGFGDRTVVIDSSQYGNSARFVRRSCIPNCRMVEWIIKTSTFEWKHGVHCTDWMQRDNLNFADDPAFPSHTQQKMQIKTNNIAARDRSFYLDAVVRLAYRDHSIELFWQEHMFL
ncbi:unnamed protein product, partial [Schistosoma mattheei]